MEDKWALYSEYSAESKSNCYSLKYAATYIQEKELFFHCLYEKCKKPNLNNGFLYSF